MKIFWEHARTWWNVHHLPNVLMVHYANLKRDLPGEIRRIAAFLEIPIDEAIFPTIVEHCTFEYMQADKTIEKTKQQSFKGAFFNKGVNGRWRDLLTK